VSKSFLTSRISSLLLTYGQLSIERIRIVMRAESSAASSGDGRVTLRVAGAVAYVQFDRPWARNAMTWAMYDGLAAACTAINENNDVRVAVLRGAGRKAFVADTDIAEYATFRKAEIQRPLPQHFSNPYGGM
jgi:Enoyl-CoA hydratase/isomerase